MPIPLLRSRSIFKEHEVLYRGVVTEFQMVAVILKMLSQEGKNINIKQRFVTCLKY